MMEDKRRAAKDILHFSVSTWVNFVLGFLSTFILTRVFVPEVMGTINLFYSTITAFVYVVCLGLNNGFLRFFNETPNGESTALLLFKLLFISITTALLLGIVSFVFFADSFVDFFLNLKGRALLICIFLGVIDQIILSFLNQSLRMRMDIRRFNIQSVLINVVTRFSVLFGAIIDRNSAELAIYLNTLCMTMFVIYSLVIQRREWLPEENFNFSFKGYKTVLLFSIYSMLGSVAVQINTLSSQIVLKTFLSTFAVGIFSSAAVFSAVLGALKGGFCTYWSAYMYANYKDESKQEWIKQIHDMITFASIIIIALFFSFRSLIYLFIGEQFRSSKEFFSLILLSPLLLFITETTQYGLPIKKKSHIVSIVFVFTLVVNVCVGIWLVPRIGIAGMAWGNALSGIFAYINLTVWGQCYYKSIPNITRSVTGIVIIVVLSFSAYIFKTDLPIIVSSIMAVGIGCLLYKDTVNKIIVLCKHYVNKSER